MDKTTATWSIQDLWNDLVTEDYPIKPRDYIRASEIGKPFFERYLTMKGVQPTNPFQSRVKRIFDVGLVFEIEVVERIFNLLGILQDSQQEVTLQHPKYLNVTGHYDHRVGGKIDLEKANQAINDPMTSSWMKRRAGKLLTQLLEKYPDGLDTYVAEIKTVNSMAFWAHKNQDPKTGFFKGYDHHKLQLFTYLMATGEKEGRLFYISKDDMTLMETPIFADDKELKEKWDTDIAEMTRLYRGNIEPEKPQDIVFNEEKKVWELNWQVSRSTYFTLMTGKKTVEDWENSLRDELKKKNTAQCKGCGKDFQLVTLNKNDGRCAKCAKKEVKPENE